MAWLSHRRQQLPESLRGGAGRAYLLRAIHAASLYLRTSSDIVTLNSACGEALKLAGAWQWYDGVLFHSMLAAADTGGEPVGWAALLRGDADLHRLFESVPSPSPRRPTNLETSTNPAIGRRRRSARRRSASTAPPSLDDDDRRARASALSRARFVCVLGQDLST